VPFQSGRDRRKKDLKRQFVGLALRAANLKIQAVTSMGSRVRDFRDERVAILNQRQLIKPRRSGNCLAARGCPKFPGSRKTGGKRRGSLNGAREPATQRTGFKRVGA
jgi:hypothetical protein